jgi:hypothetical protein
VAMVAGPPILDDPDYSFAATADSRHLVFLGGPQRESPRDLYISDLPVPHATIVPAGGTTELSDGVTLTFPPNAVTTPITVSWTTMLAPSHALGSGRVALRGFTLEARDGTGKLITQFAQPYTLRLTYTDAELAALGVDEGQLNVMFWSGSAWVGALPCAGCGVDKATNTISVKLNHFTEFSLNGAAAPGKRSLFLPVVRR